MSRFYEIVASDPNTSVASALRRAQRWLRKLGHSEKRAAAERLEHDAETVRGTRTAPYRDAKPVHEEENADDDRPYADPYYWAPFVYIGTLT
jgi:CHAT domain-containing protein